MFYSCKCIFLSLFLVVGLHFTSIAQSGISEMKVLSAGSDAIVVGKVTQQNSSWNENKTRIYTLATIQVEEYLKGSNNGGSIIVSYPGGEVGDVGELYSHMPKFKTDEFVLLFLKKDDKSTNYKVLNGEEGKINLLNDEVTGEKITSSRVPLNSLKEQISNYLNE